MLQPDQKAPDIDCDNYLKLPALEKQFLISPPASPPVGWEQAKESEPVVNFELLSRLASLATGTDRNLLFGKIEGGVEIMYYKKK